MNQKEKGNGKKIKKKVKNRVGKIRCLVHGIKWGANIY